MELASKRIKNQPLETVNGVPFKLPSGEPVRLSDMLDILILNIPPVSSNAKIPSCTMQDSLNAGEYFSQKKNFEPDTIIISYTINDWLKKLVENYATLLWGVNAVQIKKALEDAQTG